MGTRSPGGVSAVGGGDAGATGEENTGSNPDEEDKGRGEGAAASSAAEGGEDEGGGEGAASGGAAEGGSLRESNLLEHGVTI